MKKIAFFTFNPEPMCFIHVLLNALEMKQKGRDVRIVVEGKSTKLIQEMEQNKLFVKVKQEGLFDSICKACSSATDSLEYNKNCGIPLNDELNGHPSMNKYIEQGYSIITL